MHIDSGQTRSAGSELSINIHSLSPPAPTTLGVVEMLPILLWNATEKCSRCTRTRTPFLSINLPIGANVIPRVRNSLQSTRRALDSRWGYRTVPVASKVSSTLCLLFLMALATSCISIAASLSSKISKACELSQAGLSLSLSLSLSISLFLCMCIFAAFLHKTYEFVSFVQE